MDYVPLPGVDPASIVIVAAEDGVVIGAGTNFENQFSGNFEEGYVEIDHDPNTPRFGYISTYHHVLPLVKIGDAVNRGDPIATLDLTEKGPVVHFDVWDKSGTWFDPPTQQWGVQVDLYRDLLDDSPISLWTVDNDPQCLP